MEKQGGFTIAWHIPHLYGLGTRVAEQLIQAGLEAAGFGDLRPAHFRVFEHLPPHGARLTEIAQRAQATKQAIGYLVDDLVRLGYLERTPDLTDGRARLIQRTSRGHEADRVVITILAQEDAEWRMRLGDDDYDRILTALRDLTAIIMQRHRELQT